MFLDTDQVASSAGLRAIAVLLVMLNVAFVTLVAWLVLKHGKRRATAFLRQAGVIGKAAFCLLPAAFSQRKAPFRGRPRHNTASLDSPEADVAMAMEATRAGSLEPMPAEGMLSVPISSRRCMSLDSSHH